MFCFIYYLCHEHEQLKVNSQTRVICFVFDLMLLLIISFTGFQMSLYFHLKFLKPPVILEFYILIKPYFYFFLLVILE